MALARIRRLTGPLLGAKRPTMGLGLRLGFTLAAITLLISFGRIVALGAVENRVEAAATGQRLSRTVANVSLALTSERSRVLLDAEATAGAPGLADAVAAKDPSRSLASISAAHKTADASLLAVVDDGGRLLAADPATNLPLAQTAPVKQALAGRSLVAISDDGGSVDLLAAAPIRQTGPVIGAAVAVQRLDDAMLTNLLRDTGLAGALVVQDHLVAATSAIRSREAPSSSKSIALHPASAPGQPAILTVGSGSFAVATADVASIGTGRGLTLVVGEAGPPNGSGVLLPRTALEIQADGWMSLLATLVAGLAGWLIGRGLGRDVLRLGEPLPTAPAFASREVATVAAALAARRGESAASLRRVQAEVSRLRAVLDAVGEGIIVSDADRHVVLTNHAARSYLGLNGVGANGVIAFLPPASGSAEIRANERVLRSYSAPIDESGGLAGVVTVLHDATAERESERLKSEFLSVVSHELQTPLTAIVGAADLLADGEPGPLTAEQTRFLSAIRRNADRLIALVGDLLDVSRLEAGRVELDRQPVDLAALARSSVRATSNLFEQKNQSIVVEVVDPTLPPVRGDRRRLEQVIANLLANASQYTQAGGKIQIAIRPVDQGVELAVADNGPGISHGDQAHIFDKFYRGSSAASRRERGSGIGLAIVRSLVELHGGQIWVQSAPGRGARFVVILPVATEGDE